jgi:hypothetical protein
MKGDIKEEKQRSEKERRFCKLVCSIYLHGNAASPFQRSISYLLPYTVNAVSRSLHARPKRVISQRTHHTTQGEKAWWSAKQTNKQKTPDVGIKILCWTFNTMRASTHSFKSGKKTAANKNHLSFNTANGWQSMCTKSCTRHFQNHPTSTTEP